MSERQYVPHAKTGEPVPVLTPEEQAAEAYARDHHPTIYVSGWWCHCGRKGGFSEQWLAIGDTVDVSCQAGHRALLRFLPETFP